MSLRQIVVQVMSFLLLAPLLAQHVAAAGWPLGPYEFVRVGPIAPNGYAGFYGSLELNNPVATDDAGGVIVAWPRGGHAGWNLAAQRVDSAAAIRWGAGAMVADSGLYSVVVADGAGGAFVTWADWRGTTGPDYYAQHVDPSGAPTWDPAGVIVCKAEQPQGLIKAQSDGMGGLILVWEDDRDQLRGRSTDIYAQRLNSAGVALWGANGTPVAARAVYEVGPQLLPTGDGGAIVAWTVFGNDQDTVLVERLGPAGSSLWGAPTRLPMKSHQGVVRLLADARGGAVVGLKTAIHRIGSDGTIRWALSGPSGSDEPAYLQAGIDDGTGGSYWLFVDAARSASVTRVDSAGVLAWSAPVTLGNGFVEWEAILVPDGSGGVIASWLDTRSGTRQVYAQRLDSEGRELWTPGGLAVFAGAGSKDLLGAVSDGAHGLIVVWDDHGAWEIRAQRVRADGSMQPVAAPGPDAITMSPPIPNPTTSGTLIRFSLLIPSHVRVSLFDLTGRAIDRLFEGELSAGAHDVYLRGYRRDYRRLANGVYLVLVEAAGHRAATRIVLLGGPSLEPGRPQ